MAYVRQHGNQLAIVSGERDKETGNVQQQILFTLYSREEALAAIGKDDGRDHQLFQNLLQRTYPTIKFDWDKIEQTISEKLEILPDKCDQRKQDLSKEFEKALTNFARKLILADPYDVTSAKDVLVSQKENLIALREIIDERLEDADIDFSSNPPYREDTHNWRYLMRGSDVPNSIEEWAEGFYEDLQYDKAKGIFNLLVKSFDNYAEGHNYLGLIALAQKNSEEAIEHFEKTTTVGRNLFPKATPKTSYWMDLSTRPYMRGLSNLVLALTTAGQYEKAITICDRLEKECGDSTSANAYRASCYLNIGEWEKAAAFAAKAQDSFVGPFALFELGNQQKALSAFIHDAIESPHIARMLLQMPKPKPTNLIAVEDHNSGIYLKDQLAGYFKIQPLQTRKFFKDLAKNAIFIDILKKVDEYSEKHMSKLPQKQHHENFAQWHSMKERTYSTNQAKAILKSMKLVSA